MDGIKGQQVSEAVSSSGVPDEDDAIELFCIPCNRDGSLISAYGYCQACLVYLCEDCYQQHRRTTATMDHFVLDKENMPKGHKLPVPNPTDKTEFCQKHSDKRIEYYCAEHCVLGCSACVTLDHRSCKVNYIPDVAKNVHHSEELRTTFSEIRALESKCQLNIITARENIKRAKSKQHDLIQEVRVFRQELNKYLDRLEETTLSEMHKIMHDYIEKLESSKDACLHIAGEIANLENVLKRLNQTEHLNGLFVEMKKTEKKLEQMKEEAEKAFDKSWEIDHKFVPHDSILNVLHSEKQLGTVLESNEKFAVDQVSYFQRKEHEDDKGHNETVEAADTPTKPVLKFTGDVNVRSEEDWQEVHVTGLAVMAPDRLAVVDHRNEKVKVIDLPLNAVVTEIKLKSSPFDITVLPNHELAVTLPEEMTVQILHGNKLSLTRRFKFDKQCRGICYARDHIFVTFVAFPGEIRILNLQGEVLKTFNDTFYGKRMFDLPCYIAVDEKMRHIYVSDYSKGHVIQMTCDGKVQRIYKCRRRGYPDGLVTIDDKYVCVCCSSLHYIEVFPVEGPGYKAVNALKRDLQYPAALAMDAKKNIYASFVQKGKKWLEKVCIFKIEISANENKNDATL